MSFHDISIAIRAENRASGTFRSVALDVANLGASLGILSNEQVKAVSTLFTTIRVVQSLAVMINTATVAQNAHTTATATSIVTQNAGIASIIAHTAVTWAHVVAQKAAAIATWLHASGQMLLVGTLTVGIALIPIITAYLLAMAQANEAAARSVSMLNQAMGSSGYGYGSYIQRNTEEALRRKGIE